MPAPPFAHLDDPSHWGVIGFALILLLVLRLRLRGIRGSLSERNWLLAFLAGMPVIYLADWLRFGGSLGWLGIEIAGAAIYWTLVLLAVKRSPWFLAAGIAGHAIWDAGHYQRTEFVPDWYVVGCVVIDLAFGIYAAAQVDLWRRCSRRAEG